MSRGDRLAVNLTTLHDGVCVLCLCFATSRMVTIVEALHQNLTVDLLRTATECKHRQRPHFARGLGILRGS